MHNEDFYFPRPEYDFYNAEKHGSLLNDEDKYKGLIQQDFTKVRWVWVFFNKKCLELILTLLNIIAGNKIGLKLLRLEPFYFLFH